MRSKAGKEQEVNVNLAREGALRKKDGRIEAEVDQEFVVVQS